MPIDNIRAILFDMDGVVIDSHTDVEAFWNELGDQHGVRFTAEDFERRIHGVQVYHTLDQYFPMLNADERRVILEYLVRFEDELEYKLMPGVQDLVTRLKAHNVPVALVTSAFQRKVDAVFSQYDIADKFDALVTAESVEHGKPAPDCYLLGAERLSVPPENCIVFEDSVNGAKAGVAAGAAVIGIGKSEILTELGAKHVIPHFRDVTVTQENPALKLTFPPGFEVMVRI